MFVSIPVLLGIAFFVWALIKESNRAQDAARILTEHRIKEVEDSARRAAETAAEMAAETAKRIKEAEDSAKRATETAERAAEAARAQLEGELEGCRPPGDEPEQEMICSKHCRESVELDWVLGSFDWVSCPYCTSPLVGKYGADQLAAMKAAWTLADEKWDRYCEIVPDKASALEEAVWALQDQEDEYRLAVVNEAIKAFNSGTRVREWFHCAECGNLRRALDYNGKMRLRGGATCSCRSERESK